jgi:hypothetical protein
MSPGKPNDYINLFLEETKSWLRTQLSLDNVSAEELKKREKFYSNLKHDNYYWCFPLETAERYSIHKVIDFIHEKVKNALEIISREEMNKSLQLLFKELNDHTTNFFGFGKLFLAYLLFHSKKIGASITTTPSYDGNNLETGKLHYLLERVTSVVFETYQKDLEVTNNKLFPEKMNNLFSAENQLINNDNNMVMVASRSRNNSNSGEKQSQLTTSGTSTNGYRIYVKGYEKNTLQVTSTVYLIQIEDPKGNKWLLRKNWNDFESFHSLLLKELSYYNISTAPTTTSFSQSYGELLSFPQKNSNNFQYLLNSTEYHEKNIDLLNNYCSRLSLFIYQFQYPKIQKLMANFLETKYLMKDVQQITGKDSKNHFIYGDNIPNVFVSLKDYYQSHLLKDSNTKKTKKEEEKQKESTEIIQNTNNNNSLQISNLFYNIFEDFTSKEWDSFQKTWGPEYGMKIIHGYSLLQRIVTILGWTLEIHYFFLSMFGNTLSFSKLPLHDILTTQKELVQQFLNLSQELYAFTCSLNEDSSYKFHKNLSMTENELLRLKFHGNKIISLVQTIEKDHLDYESQLKRLKDCHERFQPLINRIGTSLFQIQNELSLNIPNYHITETAKDSPPLLLLSDDPSAAAGSKSLQNRLPSHESMKAISEDADYQSSKKNHDNQEIIITNRKAMNISNAQSKNEPPSSSNIDEEFKNDYSEIVLIAEEKSGGGGIGDDNKAAQPPNEEKIATDPAYAIFSRSNSETIRPAVEKPNPLLSADEGDDGDQSPFVTTKKKPVNENNNPHASNQPRFKSSRVVPDDSADEKASDAGNNPRFVRNEESSTVCIVC